MGRQLEVIGEAELPFPPPVDTIVRGPFTPGPGYERVRKAFETHDGKRDLDKIEVLAPRLYFDGVAIPAAQIDVADHREIIVTEAAPVVVGPTVESMTELLRARALWRCPRCGGTTYPGLPYPPMPGSRFAGAMTENCSTCPEAWWVIFPKGPNWSDA
ncbi:MAG: hypothetical protein KF773_02550 [Deltaproteobacteria bacterium]|nr:hypothetical protein [Deltaproteobacteria bacterium]MCW5801144.1 hypothetical protein [Deltaproteobacteria bacterium]